VSNWATLSIQTLHRRVVYADTRALVDQARVRFTKKWRLGCPAVAECLDETGDDLFTFLRFPKAQRKALRATNALERINGEFRRRTKAQASLPGKRPSSSCSLACSAVVTGSCERSTAGRTWHT
jgi:transposase-like protein